MSWEWTLIQVECTGCGICADICPERAILQSRDMPYPEPLEGKCTGCMECAKQCPFDAVRVKRTQGASARNTQTPQS
ncbi:MAG: 4Fe-4S dicluster domain-containing protein [Candidatus Aminicenantales bacterium]